MSGDPTDRHQYEIDKLYRDCQIWTPLGRWETITSIEDIDTVRRKVTTDRCSQGYAWTFARWQEFDAIIPRGERFVPDPEVRLVDLQNAATPRMVLVATAAQIEIPDFCTYVAEAVYLGHGQGWDVRDRRGSGELFTAHCTSKAAARTLMRSAGRAHAKGLGVRYCEERGHHIHQSRGGAK